MKVLFFGNKIKCKHCQVLYALLQRQKFDFSNQKYKYIDAFADDTQDFCDLHKVDAIPHIKIFDGENLVYEEFGQLKGNCKTHSGSNKGK